MADIRARLLAILKEPDRYSTSSLLMTESIIDLNARHRLASILKMIAGTERNSRPITEMEAVIEGECNGLAIDRSILQQALEAALLSILPEAK